MFQISLAVLLIQKIVHELVEIKVYKADYVFGHDWFENLMQLTQICLVISLLVLWLPGYEDYIESKTYLASFSLVLTWHEFFVTISKHPKLFHLRRSLAMMNQVFQTFSIYMFEYAYLFVSFAFGFYIIFLHQEVDTFKDLGTGFLKTIISFIGEIDLLDDITKLNQIGIKIFLIGFIFLVTITLMNLFNALAISDINVIMNQGKLTARLVEVNYIYKMEKHHNIWNRNFDKIHLPCLKNKVSLFQNELKCVKIVEEDDFLSPFTKMFKEKWPRLFKLWIKFLESFDFDNNNFIKESKRLKAEITKDDKLELIEELKKLESTEEKVKELCEDTKEKVKELCENTNSMGKKWNEHLVEKLKKLESTEERVKELCDDTKQSIENKLIEELKKLELKQVDLENKLDKILQIITVSQDD